MSYTIRNIVLVLLLGLALLAPTSYANADGGQAQTLYLTFANDTKGTRTTTDDEFLGGRCFMTVSRASAIAARKDYEVGRGKVRKNIAATARVAVMTENQQECSSPVGP